MIDTDDFEDSQEYLDSIYYGSHNSELAQGPIDYLNTKVKFTNPIRQWDSGKWYDEDPKELEKSMVRPVDNPILAEFNFKQHIVDKTQTTRNTLMFGSLETATEKISLWGFLTWVEFQDHIADHQPLAKDTLERLQVNSSEMYKQVGQVKFTFWLAKNHQAKTRSGYWAIVVEEPHQRNIIHSVNGQLHFNEGLTLIAKNQVRIK